MAHYCMTRILVEIALVVSNDAPYPMMREYLGKFSGAYMALYYAGAITGDEFNLYTEIGNLIFGEIVDYHFQH